MLVWSGCTQVARSRFIDYQTSVQDFAAFVHSFLDPTTFTPAEKKEELPLFLPAEFPEGEVVRRCAANVLRVHMLVLDIDRGSVEDILAAFTFLGRFGHVVYTSFSHNPNGQHKYRVVLKLSRPVDVTEWKQFFPRVLKFLCVDKIADEKCADVCHMYYIPGGSRAKYQVFGEDGAGLDVDHILALPMPEGAQEPEQYGYADILPEDERGEITQPLRDYCDARLQHVISALEASPYPGPVYGLTSHAVFGLARWAPHILSAERVRNMISLALKRRYRAESDKDLAASLYDKSIAHVDKAMTNGMGTPWWPPLVNEVPVRPFTEMGIAERFLDQSHGDVRWQPSWNNWLTWSNKYWDKDAGTELVKRRMKQTVRSIASEADPHYAEYWIAKQLYEQTAADANTSDEIKAKAEFDYEEKKKLIEEIRSFAVKSEKLKIITSAMTLANDDKRVMSNLQQFNRNPWLLNFQNGTVDLRTQEFRPHNREDYITQIIPYDYEPERECPLFDSFLNDCMLGNERMVEFIWRAIGYSACGVTDEQKMFLCHGDGANGKSTFMSLLLELFGQGGTGYGFAANSKNLLSGDGGNKHETWRMSMYVKRFVAMLEVDEGKSFAESLIKELTGSDMITGRKLYQDEWSYKPEFTLWLGINHLPHVRGTDEGIWRRLVVINFPANFKDRPDTRMPQKLRMEAKGIWARIVREAALWAKSGLVIPREVLVASTQYRQEQDPLREFMERWCAVEPEGELIRDHLWAAYEEHCTESKSRTFHERKRFYAAVEKQFRAKKVRGVRMFVGLRLKSPKERIDSMPRAILARAHKGAEDEKPN